MQCPYSPCNAHALLVCPVTTAKVIRARYAMSHTHLVHATTTIIVLQICCAMAGSDLGYGPIGLVVPLARRSDRPRSMPLPYRPMLSVVLISTMLSPFPVLTWTVLLPRSFYASFGLAILTWAVLLPGVPIPTWCRPYDD
eukprot:770216-Rhodomonas_salina.2